MNAQAALYAENIGFQYPDGPRLFSDWSASFEAGSMTAITGRSGRGKSTLLYILGLMLSPTTGDIYVDGCPVGALSDSDRSRMRARDFGFVFQDAALDSSRTVLENVTETALYRGELRSNYFGRAEALLQQFGVELPASRRPGQVSGGQAQRISLCRALLCDPRFIIADEPTGNLDHETAELVLNALEKQARAGAVVLLVTHSKETARSCDLEIEL